MITAERFAGEWMQKFVRCVPFIPAEKYWTYQNNTKPISGTIHPKAAVASPIPVKLYLLRVPLPLR